MGSFPLKTLVDVIDLTNTNRNVAKKPRYNYLNGEGKVRMDAALQLAKKSNGANIALQKLKILAKTLSEEGSKIVLKVRSLLICMF